MDASGNPRIPSLVIVGDRRFGGVLGRMSFPLSAVFLETTGNTLHFS